ncbi:Stk1 family PASTA domain-containing Ser/Thr kinase [Senegalia massiliensis]|uniref:Stk1 family PASTA domain-containing Ser/Thr kinase n=1 Tax=Senegalia massiliensis TaxID=1720316 RepID=UPI001030CDCB|nr:Stk1 family PASTA domain-containing Ser/Thr kinase [Senegalia massiliensis]
MIGKILGNRYEIVEKIGGGGMALVYKAKCKLLNRFVAIKVLRQEFVNDKAFIDKFNRESQAAASLSHPNIVNIYDVGKEDDIYYIVMEYINGKTLKQYIKDNNKIDPKKTLNITIQIAKALEHAHKNNIIHRDIKPQNIMITEENQIKVTDFGIARAVTSSTITQTNSVIGSVHYSSPEQAKGVYTDAKSDIYSLGIVMYEMITGRLPFDGESPISVALKHIQDEIKSPREIDDTIPINIDKIIRKATQKDKALRYDNVTEMLDDIKLAKSNINSDVIVFKDFEENATQVLPSIDEDTLKENNIKTTRREKNTNSDKPKKTKKNKKPKKKKGIALLAVLLAFLITAGALAGFFFLSGILNNDEISVPNFVGKTLEEAKLEAEEKGIELIVSKEEFSNEYEEGVVIEQSKGEGRKVVEGSTVEVVLSKGIETVTVPKITGQYSNNARILLNDADLEEGEVTQEFSDLPINIVISQSPEPGEEVGKETKVNYVVSKGPETKTTTVPALIGSNVDSAKNSLRAYNLQLGKIDYKFNEDVPEGIVFEQSYNSGEEVEEQTKVDIVISKGKEPEPESKDITKKFEFKLPESDEDKDVKVEVFKIKGQQREKVYDSTLNTSEKKFSVDITSQGKTTIIVYYDGKEAITKEETF